MPLAFVVNVTVAFEEADPPDAAAKATDGLVADPVTVFVTSDPAACGSPFQIDR